MEVGAAAICDVILPTAILDVVAARCRAEAHEEAATLAADGPLWEDSHVNPKNLIDSLQAPKEPLWRIDGCSSLGTQFHVVPLFIENPAPIRLHVFVHTNPSSEQAPWWEDLGFEAARHTKDAERLARLPIASYVLRVLQHWTAEIVGKAQLRIIYYSLPFGSRITFEDLHTDVRKVRVSLKPAHSLEERHLSAKRLSELWNINARSLPAHVDISELSLVRQLQDSVSTVRWLRQPVEEENGKIWVFKALTSNVKYIYHELQMLLNMPYAHPHVIARPFRLVTNTSYWSLRKDAVVGFLMAYRGRGLRDELPLRCMHNDLHMRQQVVWALQATSALRHLRKRCGIFYPDLRLDNIVIDAEDNLCLVDFEQRGVWIEFAAPEINFIDCVRMLAVDSSTQDNHDNSGKDDDSAGSSSVIFEDGGGVIADPRQEMASLLNAPVPEPAHGGNEASLEYKVEESHAQKLRTKYRALLDKLCPNWEELEGRDDYLNPAQGYNIPWICFSKREQEAAEVFMLGRLLWCIFEGQCAPQRGAVWQSYPREPEYEFPEFRRTPEPMQHLIDWCTRGRRELLSKLIIRQGSKVLLRGSPAADAAEIKRVAREWWLKEMQVAEGFLENRQRQKVDGSWDENHFGRPNLAEVETALRDFAHANDIDALA